MRKRFISGYYNYFVDVTGRVYSIRSDIVKQLKLRTRSDGYQTVDLYRHHERKTIYIHRLIAETFMPDHDLELDQVNHIDRNRNNNKLENLEWCTAEYNLQYRFKKE
jgi:hypothetical protein